MSDRQVSPISIDVGALVQSSVASLYSNLVTRPTGRAVRAAIEEQLGAPRTVSVSLIDFTEVRILDFSCADEVVAKLLLRYLRPDRPRNAFFLFRAVGELHRHAVEEVLERHKLAAVCDVGEGTFQLLGSASSDEHVVWQTLEHRRQLRPGELSSVLGENGTPLLTSLAERRLVFRGSGGGASALSALARAT